jgi:hypothetical protein
MTGYQLVDLVLQLLQLLGTLGIVLGLCMLVHLAGGER